MYTRRMPRMQVYLPTELYEIVKERQLPASELLQDAVRTQMRRLELEAASRLYTADLTAEVGEPTSRERARAAAMARRISDHRDRGRADKKAA